MAAMSRCPSVREKPPRRRKSFRFPRSAISNTNRNCRGVEAPNQTKTSQNENQFQQVGSGCECVSTLDRTWGKALGYVCEVCRPPPDAMKVRAPLRSIFAAQPARLLFPQVRLLNVAMCMASLARGTVQL
jgi:hypothetical protein